jgi:hypothetical protein
LLTLAAKGESPASAVADAVRGYVEAVYALPALRLTTGELKAQLNGMPESAAAELMTLLDRCDAAKFARDPADATELIERARQFLALAQPTTP